jgi:hypothetical protein
MTDTPEKIWVLPLWGTDYPQDCRVSEEKEDDDSQEYIRKDISDTRIEKLKEALVDSNAALGSFVDLMKYVREPYETPLSAYDRGYKVIMEENDK